MTAVTGERRDIIRTVEEACREAGVQEWDKSGPSMVRTDGAYEAYRAEMAEAMEATGAAACGPGYRVRVPAGSAIRRLCPGGCVISPWSEDKPLFRFGRDGITVYNGKASKPVLKLDLAMFPAGISVSWPAEDGWSRGERIPSPGLDWSSGSIYPYFMARRVEILEAAARLALARRGQG